ncbi:uncharacterized protein TNCV_515931 [Trichonephila clavipes]|nr:uncharacterized protein TNCV_515931 [Trichonephila clavipes]
MGSRLRKLKALWGEKKLSDGKTIGGKGRLTDAIISKLTTFYGNAIRANSHNVNEMRQAVWAHTSSTDDEPKHWFCPKGKNSWCKYNVSVHNNTVNEFSHKNTLPKAVSEPVFKDLSHLKLLRRCLGGKPQNANESLNSLIWKYSPKLIGSGINVTKIDAFISACEYNDGKLPLYTYEGVPHLGNGPRKKGVFFHLAIKNTGYTQTDLIILFTFLQFGLQYHPLDSSDIFTFLIPKPSSELICLHILPTNKTVFSSKHQSQPP